jgi:hypothetical protein
MPIIYASYTYTTIFSLPKDVFLLSVEENTHRKRMEQVYGSWWIKWDVLHYWDKDGKEIKIKSDEEIDEKKYPEETEIDYEEHAEEEEEKDK